MELAEFAGQVGASPRKQLVLVLDRAGWHTCLFATIEDLEDAQFAHCAAWP